MARDRKSCLVRIVVFISAFVSLNLIHGVSLAFRNLGVPVREAILWGAYAGPGMSGAWDTIYLSFGQYGAPLFLLSVNPDTGESRQFNGPLSTEMGSWGYTVDHENRIYCGSYYNGHLLRFDPKKEIWEDLGQPGGEKESFICRISTAPDGKIWGGTFPSAMLFSYDPKTGVNQNFGRMDPDQFYCYPTAGDDGLIYCAIQFAKVDIVVFDPEKKTKTSLIPIEARNPGRIDLRKGIDGKIYAKLPAADSWFRVEEGRRLVAVSDPSGSFAKNTLRDGRHFSVVDNKILRIENPMTKETKEISLNYEPAGSYIFTLGIGPDSRIYGSSMLPLRLFVYDPGKDSLSNLGKASLANGEVYSMAPLGDKLYLCSYPEARLSVYDPKKPLRFGEDEDDNPRDLVSLGEGLYRPRAMIAGPHGRVYVGGYPDYGLHGGAIGIYDPEKEEKRIYRHIIPNQSIASLAYSKKWDLLAAGSSVRGGNGTRPVEKEAKLILWDPKEEKKIFEVVPVSEAKTIRSLAATEDGMIYGITDNEKGFVLDVEKRIVKKVFDLGLKDPLEISLQAGPEGRLYGLAQGVIFAIDPRTDEVSLIAKPPVSIESGMAILGRKIFFGAGADLWEFELPPEKDVPGKFQ
jgi:hypothetical protein